MMDPISQSATSPTEPSAQGGQYTEADLAEMLDLAIFAAVDLAVLSELRSDAMKENDEEKTYG